MVDWLTYKGQNPWTCVALHGKTVYNEGSYLSKSPKISGGTPIWEVGKTGPAITDTHVPCGYWFKGPAPVTAPTFTAPAPTFTAPGVGVSCIATSADGQFVTIGTTDYTYSGSFTILRSIDYGEHWTTITTTGITPGNTACILDVAMSSDGMYQTVIVQADIRYIFVSSNYGVSWTYVSSVIGIDLQCVAMTSNGKDQVVFGMNSATWSYVSSDYGATWSGDNNADLPDNSSGYHFAMSADGVYRIVALWYTGLYISSDSGANWTLALSLASYRGRVAISADGKYQIVVMTTGTANGTIYVSSDFGANWVQRVVTHDWDDVAMSADGKYQIAVHGDATIGLDAGVFLSSDYGASWTLVLAIPGVSEMCVAMDATGSIQYTDSMYASYDYGATWDDGVA